MAEQWGKVAKYGTQTEQRLIKFPTPPESKIPVVSPEDTGPTLTCNTTTTMQKSMTAVVYRLCAGFFKSNSQVHFHRPQWETNHRQPELTQNNHTHVRVTTSQQRTQKWDTEMRVAHFPTWWELMCFEKWNLWQLARGNLWQINLPFLSLVYEINSEFWQISLEAQFTWNSCHNGSRSSQSTDC